MAAKLGWLAKKKLIAFIEKDERCQVFVRNKGLLCPYCQKLLKIPQDAENIPDKFIKHLTETCQAFQGPETEPVDYIILVNRKEALELVLDIKQKVTKNPSWRVVDKTGTWYCPHCAKPTSVKFSSQKKDLDQLVNNIIRHLKKCFEYVQKPGHFKTIEEMKTIIASVKKEKDFAEKIGREVKGRNEAYIQKAPGGSWICPYCTKPIEHIKISTDVILRFTAPGQMAQHILHDCPVATKGGKAKAGTELMKVAEELQKAAAEKAQMASMGVSDTVYLSSLQNELLELRKEISQNDELKQSLEKARDVVANMLPAEIPQPEGYDFATYFQASADVGGDFYDFIDLGDNRLAVTLGDVAGHGLEAALVMGMVKKALNMRAANRDDPAEVLSLTNNDIFPDLARDTFVTCFYGILDIGAHTIRFARAGHSFPLIYRPGTNELSMIKSDGMSLGIMKGAPFEKAIKISSFTLEKGDFFIQYTDGLTEAMNKAGDEYDISRFMESIKKFGKYDSEFLMTKVIKDVTAFMGKRPQQDDMSLVILRRKNDGE